MSERSERATNGSHRHLLSITDLTRDDIERLLTLTDSFVEVSRRRMPKVPALQGRTVSWLFYEDSTRTRLSFEQAAKRLSADTLSFSVSTSSVNKGESLRDTVETIEAMGVDCIVVRHRSSGVPHQIAQWVSGSVVNAGDGWHEHPTQALLDCYTIREHLGGLDGRRIAIVGDINHSRVARSDVWAFTAMGAEVTLVAPPTLLPPDTAGWPVRISHDLDAVLPEVDAVYLLRMQRERMAEALLPSLREYTALFGLTRRRVDLLDDKAIVMHPGPMNRGVEIAADVADLPRSVVVDQVRNGVAVRMAVLFDLLGSGRDLGRDLDGDRADRRGRGPIPTDRHLPNPVAVPQVSICRESGPARSADSGQQDDGTPHGPDVSTDESTEGTR